MGSIADPVPRKGPPIRRAFADLADGQVHYRHAGPDPVSRSGTGVPLVMLHASPGSSKQLEPLIAALAGTRRVVAPDTRGNGDSTPLDAEVPEIADYARATLAFLDAAGLDRVDLYGSHTGASIAVELAILAPGRVRRLVVDGMGLYSPADRDEMLAVYAPEVRPDLGGAHLLWAFMFCRDQYLFWPWFKRDAEHLRPVGLPPAEGLHDFALEVLKSISTYHRSYRAAFRYAKRDRLPLLAVPTLAVCAEEDMLFPYLDELVSLVPGGRGGIIPDPVTPAAAAGAARVIAGFLDEVAS
jgi:pimeloyl-ACP methyl ester carboxylesterase